LPLILVAAALLALIVLLATLQYRWLGQISEAERDRLRSSSSARAVEFARDFDRELTRAYLIFQGEPTVPDQDSAGSIAGRYDRWQSSARFPRMIKEFYFAPVDDRGPRLLERFDPRTRRLEPIAWPSSMTDWRDHLGDAPPTLPTGTKFFIRRITSPVWASIPALVVPQPILRIQDKPDAADVHFGTLAYTVLTIDVEYVAREVLPALAARHFAAGGNGFDYQVAVLSRRTGVLYRSTEGFDPRPGDTADASADLFQIRAQDFTTLASELREVKTLAVFRSDEASSPRGRAVVGQTMVRTAGPSPPEWRIVLKHPSGSLESAVNVARRRNLLVSSSILAVLAASIALLMLSTRRAQELARRQMEFVAGVTHELRTPLAVLRSAGDNLADGVVQDREQIRRYGELVRDEGRRLSDMVEQVLEFSGIEAGRQPLPRQPVAIAPVLHAAISSSASAIDRAGMTLETDIPDALPAVAGNEAALRRVFENLMANAVKYGAEGRWIRVRALTDTSEVRVSVADRGIGIHPAEHARVFEPFYRTAAVVSAQIQGAGLGLSLVKRTVEAHGGRVTVTSAPGAGTEFTVHLPTAELT
jgi:signal transduction histidine kinase